MDRRQAELRHIEILVDFLCDEYPHKFKRGEYTHPVKGACKTLIMRDKNVEIQVDYSRINNIEFDFFSYEIFVKLNTPVETIKIKNFFIDETVM